MSPNHDRSPLVRFFLRAFIFSVVACAVTGAAAIALPTEHSWWQVKVWLTTVIIAGASVCGLACGGCLALGHRLLPTAGILLAAIAGVMSLLGLWAEVGANGFWRVTIAATSLGVGCAHVSMLLMAQLRGAYRWAHLASYQVILGLAALIAAGVLFDLYDSEAYWRLTGVLSVATAALTLVTPVFHYFSRELATDAQSSGDPLLRIDEQIALHKKQLMDLQAERERLLDRASREDEDSSSGPPTPQESHPLD